MPRQTNGCRAKIRHVGLAFRALEVRPLFLFCLPRGGSTLVQRVIAAHPKVSTLPEPWLLLPLVYATREQGARAEYWHEATAQSVKDFSERLPAGSDDIDAAIRGLALELYEKAAEPGTTYFLDKTPHYHFIAADIVRLFPEAKLVFLWRNPLSVLASLLETFRAGKFQPAYFMRDLADGYLNLVAASQAAGERAYRVRYEELVGGQEEQWRGLFEYLELDYDQTVLSRFAEVDLKGRYGDPIGTRKYTSLSTEALSKWTQTVGGRRRKAWCRSYLDRLGDETLAAMGYELPELRRELDAVPARRSSVRDLGDLGVSVAGQAARDAALRFREAPRPIGAAYGQPRRFRDGAQAATRKLRAGLGRARR